MICVVEAGVPGSECSGGLPLGSVLARTLVTWGSGGRLDSIRLLEAPPPHPAPGRACSRRCPGLGESWATSSWPCCMRAPACEPQGCSSFCPSRGCGHPGRAQSKDRISRSAWGAEHLQGRSPQVWPLLTQTVAKEPHGKELHVVLSAGLAMGPGRLRNFPREGHATLLSPWGGSGAGHASHRKLTSKERCGEKCWQVPFPGPVRVTPHAKCHMQSPARFRGSQWEQRGCLPLLVRDAWGHMVRRGVAGTHIS